MASVLAVAVLPACAERPPDYSPHYVQVPVTSQNRVSHYALTPEACLVPDPTDTGLGGSRLPPGCANNANLLAMAEQKRDLVKGRKLGAAPASPSARAAQKYIYGSEGTLGGGVRQPNQSVTQAGTTSESAAPAIQSTPQATH
jgi:type IV pilus biogenesis protein CpaD/CtpE